MNKLYQAYSTITLHLIAFHNLAIKTLNLLRIIIGLKLNEILSIEADFWFSIFSENPGGRICYICGIGERPRAKYIFHSLTRI